MWTCGCSRFCRLSYFRFYCNALVILYSYCRIVGCYGFAAIVAYGIRQ